MNEKLIQKLLREPKERDWLDFKRQLKLYQGNGSLVDKQRDELIKDLLGLANGNGQIIRKTKYLIIGADNKEFDNNGMRLLHNVDYKVPTQSELATWLKKACSPAVAGLECEEILVGGSTVFVIIVPPTFDLHETMRELITPNGNFHEHTVFMRQDEHTVPASVRDGIIIQQLKHLHRREISNPSSIWIGIISGGLVGFFLGGSAINTTEDITPELILGTKFVLGILGVLMGGVLGWFIRQLSEASYDLRYMNRRQRVSIVLILLVAIILGLFFLPR
jgi:hypothetical protein